MADGPMLMFRTVNLHMQNTWLRREVARSVHEGDFAAALRGLQQTYIGGASRLDPAAWNARSVGARLVENKCRLTSRLL
jgi:hypothetical protein